jgi:hypothetical protein
MTRSSSGLTAHLRKDSVIAIKTPVFQLGRNRLRLFPALNFTVVALVACTPCSGRYLLAAISAPGYV